jgi:hypothetical protein
MLRALIGSLILWPLYLALFVVLLLIGFVLIPLAVMLRWYYFTDTSIHWLSKAMRPWDNLEHGIAGFTGYKPEASLAYRIICWSAFRNPVNGLRHLFGIKVNPDRIGHIGNSLDPEAEAMHWGGNDYTKTFWAFTWQGPLAGFKLARAKGRRMTEVWIGWKFLPMDRFGERDWRTNAVGFAIQPFLKWDY